MRHQRPGRVESGPPARLGVPSLPPPPLTCLGPEATALPRAQGQPVDVRLQRRQMGSFGTDHASWAANSNCARISASRRAWRRQHQRRGGRQPHGAARRIAQLLGKWGDPCPDQATQLLNNALPNNPKWQEFDPSWSAHHRPPKPTRRDHRPTGGAEQRAVERRLRPHRVRRQGAVVGQGRRRRSASARSPSTRPAGSNTASSTTSG